MNSRMKGKPNFDEFRSGGAAEAQLAPPPAPAAAPPVAAAPAAESAHALAARQATLDSARENKTIRMRKSFSVKVRALAFNRSNAEGRKVNESDIIDEALEQYFSKQQ